MKKLLSYLMLAGILSFTTVNVYAQDEVESDSTEMTAEGDSTMVESDSAAVEEEVVEEEPAVVAEPEPEVEASFHQVVKDQFIAGGPEFMGIVLLCLILGLAVAIESIIHLNLATTNVKKLLQSVDDALLL